MSNVAELRARIAARRSTDITRVPVCLDVAQARQIAELEGRLADLEQLREETLAKQKAAEKPGDVRLSGDRPVAKVDTEIKTTSESLDAAWAAAEGFTFIVVLRALLPDGDTEPGQPPSYQALLNKHADAFVGDEPPVAWCADLAEACYVRAETTDGDDLAYSWAELRAQGLNHGDWNRIWQTAVVHNRQAPSLDFSRRRSATRRRAAK